MAPMCSQSLSATLHCHQNWSRRRIIQCTKQSSGQKKALSSAKWHINAAVLLPMQKHWIKEVKVLSISLADSARISSSYTSYRTREHKERGEYHLQAAWEEPRSMHSGWCYYTNYRKEYRSSSQAQACPWWRFKIPAERDDGAAEIGFFQTKSLRAKTSADSKSNWGRTSFWAAPWSRWCSQIWSIQCSHSSFDPDLHIRLPDCNGWQSFIYPQRKFDVPEVLLDLIKAMEYKNKGLTNCI